MTLLIFAILLGTYLWQHHQPILQFAGLVAQGVGVRAYHRGRRALFWLMIHVAATIGSVALILSAHTSGSNRFMYAAYFGSIAYTTVAMIGFSALTEPLLTIAGLGLPSGLIRRSVDAVTWAFVSIRNTHTALSMALLFFASFALCDYQWQMNAMGDYMVISCLALITLSALTVRLAGRAIWQVVTYKSMFITTATFALLALFPALFPGPAEYVRVLASGDSAKFVEVTGDTPAFNKTEDEDGDTIFVPKPGANVTLGTLCRLKRSTPNNSAGVVMIQVYCPTKAVDPMMTQNLKAYRFWIPRDSTSSHAGPASNQAKPATTTVQAAPAVNQPAGTTTGQPTASANAPVAVNGGSLATGCGVARVNEGAELIVPSCFNHTYMLPAGTKRLVPKIDTLLPVVWQGKKAELVRGFGTRDTNAMRPNLAVGMLMVQINDGIYQGLTSPVDIPEGGKATIAVNGGLNQHEYQGRYIVQVTR